MKSIQTFDDSTVETILQIVRDYRAGKLGYSSRSPITPTQSSGKSYFVNNSGEEIPAYACMRVTGTQEINGQNYLTVIKPNVAAFTVSRFVFNSEQPVAAGEYGVFQTGSIVRGYYNTGTPVAGERYRWTSDQWYLTRTDLGPYVVAGIDDIRDKAVRLFVDPSIMLCHFTLTSGWTSGVADATIRNIISSVGSFLDTDEVIDGEEIFTTLESGDAGLCVLQDGKFYAIQAACPE